MIGTVAAGVKTGRTDDPTDEVNFTADRSGNRFLRCRDLGSFRSVMPQESLSRRHLLMSAGVGLVAAAAQGVPLAPPDKQPPDLKVPKGQTKKVRWAIVGLGKLALEEVMPAFAQCLYSQPTALVSGHPDKARQVAEFYGIDPKRIYNYDNFDKIAEDDQIDVVYNILPNHMHAEFSNRAMAAGKHVLCEKPLTGTVAEARSMVATAKKTGRKLMTAYRLRYEPFNMKAIEILRSGELGKIDTIEAQNFQTTEPPNIRLSRKTAGGPLGDVGIYCLNATRYLTGEEPAEASAMAHKPSEDERFAEVPESVLFQLRFPSGILAMCGCGFGSQESRRFRVNCTKGWLELQNAFAYRGQRMLVSKEKQTTEYQIRPVDHFQGEMDHFSQCVLENKEPLTPGEEGLRDMLHMAWIDEAARTGQRVQINDNPPNVDQLRQVTP